MAARLGLAALAIVAAALTGCGDDDEPQADATAATTEIEITLDPDGNGGEAATTESVACPGAAAAICDAISALPADPAAPVPAQTACTEIYGGPDTLAIEGTLRNEPVEATFTRANGCEIERFERFGGLLAELFPDYEPGASLAP